MYFFGNKCTETETYTCIRKQDVNEAQLQTCKLSKCSNENRENFRRVIIGKLPEFNKITEAIDVNDKSTIHYAVENFSSMLKSAAETFLRNHLEHQTCVI